MSDSSNVHVHTYVQETLAMMQSIKRNYTITGATVNTGLLSMSIMMECFDRTGFDRTGNEHIDL